MTAAASQPTGFSDDAFLAALWADPRMEILGPDIFEATKPFALALPTLLADILDQPVTLELIYQAKVVFLRHCIEHDYVGAIRRQLPDDLFGNENKANKIFEDMQQSFVEAVNELEAVDVAELLASQGFTGPHAGVDVLLEPSVGLNLAAQDACCAGDFTMRRLLALCPAVIVVTTGDDKTETDLA